MLNSSVLGAERKVYSLSLKDYTEAALQRSLRAQTAEESLMSSQWGWIAARRGLTWPSLSAAATKKKSFSDNDLGTETTARTDSASVSLSQPFLTDTSVGVTGTWTDTNTDTEVAGLTTPTYDAKRPAWIASITQPLFLFTGNSSWRAWREARLGWGNDRDTYRGERLNIEFEARTIYYNLLLQRETAAVEKKKFESAQLVHKTTQALVKAGKLARVELARADIRASRDRRRIQYATSSFEKAVNEARDFVLLPAPAELRLTSPLRYEPFKVPLPRLREAAERHNPGLQTAKRQVELSQISLRRTKNGDRPKINAIGNYSLTRDRGDGIPTDPTSWDATLNLSWAFFDASQTRLRVKQSEVSLGNSRRALERAARDLAVSVENAYLEIKRTEEQIAEFDVQRENGERNVRAMRLQYENGLTRLTDVFDAENELRDLELEYLGLLVNFNTARDRLKVLIGADPVEIAKAAPR